MSLKNLFGLVTAAALVLPNLTSAQDNVPAVREVESLTIGQKTSGAAPSVETVKEPVQASITVTDVRDSKVFQIIPVDDELVSQRFKKLENIMPMPYNEHVRKYLDYFLLKRPSFVKEMLEKKEFYFPVFEKYLAKHNIPDEMKYLSLLESGLNPNAVSRAKAVGLWQFMSYTGKEYGLRITDYMDERRHIEKSTDASFRYLTNLYRQFDDWELALAAYNTGPGRIRRAIRSSGESDYWSLHNYIHPDTRAYVPQWEALHYLMNYASEHGIFADPNRTILPMQTENLLLDGPLNLESFAKLSYMEFETLKLLNPHLTANELPSHARSIEIKVPVINYAYFEQNKKCILDSACIITSPTPEVMLAQEDKKGSYHIEHKEIKKYHTVRSGDYLGKIADNYNVRISDVKRWNNLRSNTVMKGQRLVIYQKDAVKVYDELNTEPSAAPEVKTTLAKNVTTPQRNNVKVLTANAEESSTETEDVEETTAQPVKTVAAASPKASKSITKQVKRYHTVGRGDNLTQIANKYHTTIKDLKNWNNLQSSKIMKGQKLMYYTTVTEKVYETTPSKRSDDLKMYTVQRGDTLWNISQRFGYSVDELKKMNGLTNSDVRVGQKLKI